MEESKKLIKKKISLAEVDSVSYHRSKLYEKGRDMELVDYARRTWQNMQDYREGYARGNRMTYGDQWSDIITIWKKKRKMTMTMREYMAREGHIPLQANMIKPMVNTILGVLVKEQNEPICNARDRDEQQYGEVMTATLQANCNKNRLDSVTNMCIKDFLIGGLGVCKERYGDHEGRQDSWTEYVNPNYLILDTGMKDPRHWDMRMIGTWYDMSKAELIKHFVKTPQDLAKLKEIYGDVFNGHRTLATDELTDKLDNQNIEFMTPLNQGDCCVLEMWTKEIKQRVRLHDTNEGTLEVIDADDKDALAVVELTNKSRMLAAMAAGWDPKEAPLIDMEYFIDEYWHCHLLAPDGTILEEFESPYAGKMHPFSLIMTPMTDGRITGYLTDAFDLQHIMNRAVCIWEWSLRNNVKGLTFIPKGAIPDETSNEDFVEDMRIDNVAIYDEQKAKGAKPEVFHGASATIDIASIMTALKTMIGDTMSVTGAIQGRTPYSGTSAAMYAQMTANSSTPIASVMKDVRLFLEDVATKKLKNIAKFYEPERYAEIVGSIDGIFDNANLNLNEVGDIEYDLSIKEGTETPVYRQTANDYLISFMQAGAVTPSEALRHGHFPWADKILQEREAREAEMQAAQEGEMGADAQEQANQMGATAANNLIDNFGTPENGNVVHSTRPIVR